MVFKEGEWRAGVPGLWDGMIACDQDKGNIGIRERLKSLKCGDICMGTGFDRIKEIACMNKSIRLLFADRIDRCQKIIIDLFFPEVHA